ncbi:type III ribulose-bisphosphate carboxylase [Candidatus Woesearchaeota archaeon]|nr:type III ribulose-bisphosphate carboxylase [Candidatus Woesearchaeota archaeon]
MLDYVDLKYKPTKNDLVVQYYVEPAKGLTFEQACEQVAAESSIGTWTELSTMNKKIATKLRPSVYSINKKKRLARIAYPQELFEAGNMPQILSAIAGNIYGMKVIDNLRLTDITFPKKMVQSFKGPRYGIKGIRKMLKLPKRPLLGTIVKPKVGLDEAHHAKVAYDSWVGGLDIVKDDENLTSMSFNNFQKRIDKTLKLRDKAERETGEKKIYMPNITAETFEMLKRAKYVERHGGEYVMVDVLTAGFAGLQTVRDHVFQVLHAHRAGHGALTRNPKHGITMHVLAMISRLIGVDQLHIGTADVGKMEGSPDEVLEIEREIEEPMIKGKNHILAQDWHGVKPVFAVASGGLHPGSIPKVHARMGPDVIMQFGGGVHGHPNGTLSGARAVRQAMDAVQHKSSLTDWAQNRVELKKALIKWGEAK